MFDAHANSNILKRERKQGKKNMVYIFFEHLTVDEKTIMENKLERQKCQCRENKSVACWVLEAWIIKEKSHIAKVKNAKCLSGKKRKRN